MEDAPRQDYPRGMDRRPCRQTPSGGCRVTDAAMSISPHQAMLEPFAHSDILRPHALEAFNMPPMPSAGPQGHSAVYIIFRIT